MKARTIRDYLNRQNWAIGILSVLHLKLYTALKHASSEEERENARSIWAHKAQRYLRYLDFLDDAIEQTKGVANGKHHA